MLYILFLIPLWLNVMSVYSMGNVPSSKEAFDYLGKYGYYDSFSSKPTKAQLKESLTRLQTFAGIRQTGRLDSETIKLLKTDRCGMPDPKLSKRKRRYILQGTKWLKNTLTWRLENGGDTISKEKSAQILREAFSLWSSVANLEFIEIDSGVPDIRVRFERLYHNDGYVFDGNGGTLAHAFYPAKNKGLAGDVHFDDDETFTYKSKEGRNLLWVATHEIGHSLGLDHSNVRNAIMFPWYTAYKPGFKLTSDDKYAIQVLYGPAGDKSKPVTTTVKTTTTTTTRRTTTTKKSINPSKKRCPKSAIQAVYYNSYANLIITMTEDSNLYFVYKTGGIRYGPIPQANYFRNIKDKITAAVNIENFERSNRDATILFAGTNFYVYQHFRLKSGPISIHGNNMLNLKLPQWVKRIDAAMTWYRNKKTYFFFDQYYWRYNSQTKSLDRGYPKLITKGWLDMPDYISAAYSSREERTTFFIKGNQKYKLNDAYVALENNYPEHIGKNWLKCHYTDRSQDRFNFRSRSRNRNRNFSKRRREP